MINKVFVVVTADEYELPVFIGDSIQEVADQFNSHRNTIKSTISRNIMFKHKYYIRSLILND
jgi:hypothetical protein